MRANLVDYFFLSSYGIKVLLRHNLFENEILY